jgi:hypothetical protein
VEKRTQFRWFVTLWVMAFSFHFFEGQPLAAWLVLLAGIPCLAAPSSVVAFAVFLGAGGLVVANDLPAPANHFFLALVVSLTFAASAVVILRRRGSATETAGAGLDASWIDVARTPVGLTLLIVYFFGVFHKLNTSFFDPQVSCAGTLLSDMFSLQGLDSGWITGGVVVGNAVLTVTLEALILVCLAVPRWRRWGLLFGVVFHFGLAWALFYDFAGFVFALYVLLLPPETWARVRRPESWRRMAISGWAVHAAVSLAAYLSASSMTPVGLRWHTLQVATWSLAVGALMLPLLRASFAPGAPPLRAPRWNLRPAWLLVFPALALLNGATPYLGLKTVSAYSMFSNLRTEEGRTNHVIGAVGALEVADYQRDTVDVQVLEFPDPLRLGSVEQARGGAVWIDRQTRWANEEGVVRVPWIELRRAVLFWKDVGIRGIRIRYERDGLKREVPDVVADPELTQPLPWWERRLLAFREIERGGDPVECRW